MEWQLFGYPLLAAQQQPLLLLGGLGNAADGGLPQTGIYSTDLSCQQTFASFPGPPRSEPVIKNAGSGKFRLRLESAIDVSRVPPPRS